MIEKFLNLLKYQDSLEKTLFWLITALSLLVGILSTFLSLYEDVGVASVVAGFGCCVIFVVLGIFAYRTQMYTSCYLVMCGLICLFLEPLLFFVSGGFMSAMSLYFLAGIIMLSLSPAGRAKNILFVLSMAVFTLSFIVSEFFPNLVTLMSPKLVSLDVIVSFLILGCGVFALGSHILKAYNQELLNNKNLVAKLDFLSKHDSLTRLYNRRYLIDYLGNFIWQHREGFYIAMFRIDKYAEIQNDYGPFFGDVVVCDVARLASQNEVQNKGECVSHFGGPNIVHVMHASSEFDALERAECFRKEVAQLNWEEHPDLRVTVRGVVSACDGEKFTDTTQLLQIVYGLLSKSRQTEDDQIRCV